jgi:hypothetical protein
MAETLVGREEVTPRTASQGPPFIRAVCSACGARYLLHARMRERANAIRLLPARDAGCVGGAPPLMTLLQQLPCCARREMRARVMPLARWRRPGPAGDAAGPTPASCCISSAVRWAAADAQRPRAARLTTDAAFLRTLLRPTARDVDFGRDRVESVWDAQAGCRLLPRPRACFVRARGMRSTTRGFSPGARHWSAPRRLPARARRPPARE